jgi:hypothetical protein
MKKIVSLLLSSFILSCQSNNIIIKPYQEVTLSKKENIIDLGNKGPSVKININFNRTNPFNIKNINDSFNGINNISRLEVRLSNSQGLSLADRFGLDCPCPPNTRKGVAYIDILNPSLSNSITVKGLKPNTSYYLSARAYSNLKVNGNLQERNVVSSDGTPNDTLGGGTAGAFGTFSINEEYISVDANGVLTINNDDNDNNPVNGLTPNNNWDISLQLMKSRGASINSNSGLVKNGDNTTNVSIKPNYSLYSKSNVMVNRTISGDQFSPSVAIADNGNYMITWDSLDGTDYQVFARLYDKYGKALTDEIIVNDTNTGNQRFPYITTDGNSFFIFWSGEGSGDTSGIFGKKFNNDGTVALSEFKVNTNTAGTQSNVKAAKNSLGDMVVVWQSDETSDHNIKAQRYNSSGPVGSEFIVNTYTLGEQISPSVDIDNLGNFIISWEGEGNGDNDGGIFFKKFDNTGTELTSDIRVNEDTINIQNYSSLAMNKNTGDFVISFVSSDNNVHLQKYFTNTRKKGNEIVLTNPFNSSYSQVSINNSNQGYLTWQQNNGSGNTFIEIRNFYFFDDIINSYSLYYNDGIYSVKLYVPFIAINGKNGVIVWADNSSAITNSDIYFKKLLIP